MHKDVPTLVSVLASVLIPMILESTGINNESSYLYMVFKIAPLSLCYVLGKLEQIQKESSLPMYLIMYHFAWVD